MGISGTTYSNRSNELTYQGYLALGGASNPRLMTVQRSNGTHIYTTYHIIG